MKAKVACFAAAICLYALLAFVYAPVISDHPFGYDEADYMWAGTQGLWANYSSEHAISFVEFVRKGLELSRDAGKRQSYSEYIRASGDIDFYRHYHGPMYVYWVAMLHAAGVERENVFRGSGLLIHFASATLILFGFWAIFPSLPPLAALAPCALFAFDRAGLTAASTITQHLLFTFFCTASLLACSLFLRNLESRWFYAALALIACAVSTVETSVLLLVALGLSMIVEHRRVREKWPTLKGLGGLLGRGTAIFVLTMLICWPMGVLKLGIAKSFLTLIYFALSRKTYSSQGPLALWRAMFQASPWEFALLVPGTVAAFALWRRFADRRELLPWLVFIAFFVLATFKMTLPYPYYYAPLTAACAVATGFVAGIMWMRWRWTGRMALVLALAVSSARTTILYRDLLRNVKAVTPYESVVLHVLGQHPVDAGRELYLPFQLVPMMHYYHPNIKTVGYDFDFPLPRLADGIQSKDAAGIMFCEAAFCDRLEFQAPVFAARKTLLDRPGPNGQPFYVIEVRKSGSL